MSNTTQTLFSGWKKFWSILLWPYTALIKFLFYGLIAMPLLWISWKIWQLRAKRTYKRVHKEFGFVTAAQFQEEYPQTFEEYYHHIILRSKVA